jgi:hypothetical protein
MHGIFHVYIGNQTVAEFFHTMRRQFTSYEWQTIKQRPSERKQLEMFMRHWVGSVFTAYIIIIIII